MLSLLYTKCILSSKSGKGYRVHNAKEKRRLMLKCHLLLVHASWWTIHAITATLGKLQMVAVVIFILAVPTCQQRVRIILIRSSTAVVIFTVFDCPLLLEPFRPRFAIPCDCNA